MTDQSTFLGVHDHFFWLSSSDHYIGTLLRVCPEVVLDRYVVITANDSGIPKLDTKHLSSGWRLQAGVAYSAKISSVDEIPHQLDGPETPGFDEIYVFDFPVELGELSYNVVSGSIDSGKTGVFVNTLHFSIHDSSVGGVALEKLFWSQIEQLSPYAYIADGRDWLSFVTRDQSLMTKVYDRFTSEAHSNDA